MGVPGFFAWLLRHYSKNKIITSEIEKKPKILYIDANCLFHPQCFKILENYPPSVSIDKLESYMMKRIINYIHYLIAYCDPETVFLAVDGVAPVAKISQQRKRRFKSVEDNRMRNDIKRKYGKEFNDTWSNIKITPSTVFMEKLHQYILADLDKLKTTRKIIYSSYHTNGEGEHKILQDIKKRNSHDDIYVIYGLDADLFFLSMASQQNNIFLLRESNELDSKKNVKPAELYDPIEDVAEDLKYVSIDKTKECYNEQMRKLLTNKKESMLSQSKYSNFSESISKSEFDKKDFTNDFVFLCYLLGNDFLPHIPSIDIKKSGLDFLLDCYTELYLITDLNLIAINGGKVKINHIILIDILRMCANKENYFFTNILSKHTELNNKKKCPYSTEYEKEIWNLDNLKENTEKNKIDLGSGTSKEWISRYYKHYFNDDSDQLKDNICLNYFEGLEWVTKYYFETCPSWQWQYKYTHSPFVSDLYRYIKNNYINVTFKNEPALEPVVQLLSVLPPTYSNELPKNYVKLVTDDSSPIKYMFPDPKDIHNDTLYKDQLWQCVPMIPYLDVKKIIEACRNIKLSKDEKTRNAILGEFVFP